MKVKMKTIRNFLVVLIVAVAAGGVGFWVGQNEIKTKWANFRPEIKITSKIPPKEKNIDFNLFWQVWDKVSAVYVDKDKLDAQKMVYGAIAGMVAGIGDPYTVFLPPQQNKESKEALNGSFEGIGAQLGVREQRIIVVAPLSGMPAERAGIKAGDWIVKVDGKETIEWSLPEAVAKIRGPKGTTVALEIWHEKATRSAEIEVVRETIKIKSAEWKKMNNNIVYLKLSRFGEDTDGDWDGVVRGVGEVGEVRGIVLDLRNNPGGYLQGAVDISSEFLKSGTMVVKQVNGDGTSQTYNVNRLGKMTTAPMVVLINGGSASASEIVAGALQAHKRAKLVGIKSFGKGSVQEAQDLPNGAGLHVTISKWLLPNGKWINGSGLTPDVKIENDEANPAKDLQLEKAISVILATPARGGGRPESSE